MPLRASFVVAQILKTGGEGWDIIVTVMAMYFNFERDCPGIWRDGSEKLRRIYKAIERQVNEAYRDGWDAGRNETGSPLLPARSASARQRTRTPHAAAKQ
jgi:hypothetical protein